MLAPCLACLLLAPGGARTTPAAPSAEVTPGPHALLQSALDHGLPGVALAFNRADGPVEIAVAGHADLARGIPLRPEHAFHLASVTKAFTAAAALRLIDEGELAAGDRVQELLGEEAMASLPYAGRVTVAQLLDHSSGFRATNNDPAYLEAWIGPRAIESAGWSDRRFVELAARGEPFAPPGEGHFYSDTNYVLLGRVVEAVAGRPLAEHVRRTIFEPLGMDSAHYFSELEVGQQPPHPTVRGYLRMSEVIHRITDLHPRFPEVRPGLRDTTDAGERIPGAAAIVANAADLHRFAGALLRGDLLSPASRRRLLSVADGLAEEPVGSERQEILAAYHRPWGVIVTAEGDGPGGSNVQVVYHPASDLLAVAMTNLFGHFDEAEILREEIVRPLVVAGR